MPPENQAQIKKRTPFGERLLAFLKPGSDTLLIKEPAQAIHISISDKENTKPNGKKGRISSISIKSDNVCYVALHLILSHYIVICYIHLRTTNGWNKFFIKSIKSHVGFWTLWKTGPWTYELETYTRKSICFQAISKKQASYQALLIISALGIVVGDLKRTDKPRRPPWEDYLDLEKK